MSTDNKLIDSFEKEIWLYLDGSLSSERIKFWDEHRRENNEINEFYKSTISTLNIYDKNETIENEPKYFDELVRKAINKKQRIPFKLQVKNKFNSSTVRKHKYKLAFGTGVIAVALFLLFSTKTQNPVEEFNPNLLSWESENYVSDVEDVEGTILMIKNDKFKQYVINRIEKDIWLKDFSEINNRVAILETKFASF